MAEFLQLWGGHLIAAAVFLWTIAVYYRGARKEELEALRQDIDKQKADLAEHKEDGTTSRAALSERLGQVELKLQQMPDKESVHQLALAVTEIRGDIRTQGETMKAVAATASRVEEFLLQRNRA